jgi:predicted O-methyltransferase YrrM
MAGRLLRVGGIVAIDNALWHDKVADPSVRDAETIAVREVGKQLLDDEDWTPVLLPVGDGLLCAVKTA